MHQDDCHLHLKNTAVMFKTPPSNEGIIYTSNDGQDHVEENPTLKLTIKINRCMKCFFAFMGCTRQIRK